MILTHSKLLKSTTSFDESTVNVNLQQIYNPNTVYDNTNIFAVIFYSK